MSLELLDTHSYPRWKNCPHPPLGEPGLDSHWWWFFLIYHWESLGLGSHWWWFSKTKEQDHPKLLDPWSWSKRGTKPMQINRTISHLKHTTFICKFYLCVCWSFCCCCCSPSTWPKLESSKKSLSWVACWNLSMEKSNLHFNIQSELFYFRAILWHVFMSGGNEGILVKRLWGGRWLSKQTCFSVLQGHTCSTPQVMPSKGDFSGSARLRNG